MGPMMRLRQHPDGSFTPFTEEENAEQDALDQMDAALATAAAAAQARYETHEGILDATAALMENAHEDGQPWVQPTGAHDAYLLGHTVTNNGKTWENLTHANVWEPGVSGWREVVSEGYPAWIQPTGGHDAYALGTRVTHNGQDWESNVPGNVWEPGVFGWTLI